MLVSARTHPPFQLMKNLFNLVFAFVLLTGITSLSASAQVLSSDDTLKVLKTYHRLTALITDEMVERYLPNLVNLEEVDDKGYSYKLGVTGARRLLWAVAVQETVGDPTLKKGDQYGLLQIRPIMLEDYFRLKPKADRFDISELQRPENIYLSMKVLNAYIGCAGYEMTSKERVLRAWQGGPDGWWEHKIPKGDTPEKHELELQRTWKYYQKILEYERMCTFFEENGYAHIMWDWQGSPPSISAPPKL